MDKLWELSASQVAGLIRQKKLSATEVTQSALTRLEQVNPTINAVIDYRPELALKRANEVDIAIANGESLGTLSGVPVTVKVNIDQFGFATTNGLQSQKDLIANCDSPVVDNLNKSGAIILGRTNTPAFSYRWFTNNIVHGHTYNPRNRALTPGGSSGGAAASVAAGIGYIAHGNDIAGSVRYPAYACGVHGLRPTLGRIANYNATGVERTIGGQIMAVSGPIARTIHDLRMGFEVMSQEDARDPWWVPVPLYGKPVPRIAAVCLYPDGMDTDPEIVQALLDSADKLRDAGWIVDEVDDLPPIKQACGVQVKLWMGDGYENLINMAQKEGDKGAITALIGQKDMADSMDLSTLSQALTLRATIIRKWKLFLENYPVVLLANSADLPFEDNLDLKDEASYQRVWQAQMPMIGLPVTGLPAISITTGMVNNKPVGVQIVSQHYREDLCLQAAEVIEQRSIKLPIAM